MDRDKYSLARVRTVAAERGVELRPSADRRRPAGQHHSVRGGGGIRV